jgi:hypothetical protein
MNNICIIDKSLSNEECDLLINEFSPKLQESLKAPWNYSFYDTPLDNKILQKLAYNIIEIYKKKYPEVNYTHEKWSMKKFRFKVFEPGDYYDILHSEQSSKNARILSILIYLSDHNCGTEFYDGTMVKSVKGRSLIFPAFWTHAHKGQPCPDKKRRFILSAYATLDGEI